MPSFPAPASPATDPLEEQPTASAVARTAEISLRQAPRRDANPIIMTSLPSRGGGGSLCRVRLKPHSGIAAAQCVSAQPSAPAGTSGHARENRMARCPTDRGAWAIRSVWPASCDFAFGSSPLVRHPERGRGTDQVSERRHGCVFPRARAGDVLLRPSRAVPRPGVVPRPGPEATEQHEVSLRADGSIHGSACVRGWWRASVPMPGIDGVSCIEAVACVE